MEGSSSTEHQEDGSSIVDCVCGVKGDDGEEMVCCDDCDVWGHTHCSSYVKGQNRFTCHKCKSKNMGFNSEEAEVVQILANFKYKFPYWDEKEEIENRYPKENSTRRSSWTKGEENETLKTSSYSSRKVPNSTTSSGPCSSRYNDTPMHRTLPDLLNEIITKDKSLTYEEICNAVLPTYQEKKKLKLDAAKAESDEGGSKRTRSREEVSASSSSDEA